MIPGLSTASSTSTDLDSLSNIDDGSNDNRLPLEARRGKEKRQATEISPVDLSALCDLFNAGASSNPRFPFL